VFRDGRVYVGKVTPKSPMAQAGVEADDILLSLDGEKIATQADAVKLLRQKSAEFLPFFVRVKRGDRELELIVPWSLPPAKR
jgi:S1-C subfamily serine protease